MQFDILTIFPDIFGSYLKESLIKRGIKNGIIKINAHDIRKYSKNRHNKVDDKPYGGGPGMVLSVESIHRAVLSIKNQVSRLRQPALRRRLRQGEGVGGQARKKSSKSRTILFSTRGKKLDAKTAKRLSKYDSLILICGRYEGVDERVAEHIADEEISIGDYVLNGGELAAMVLMETVSRFLPGFLGKMESLEEIKGSYPSYTRPAEFVPEKGAKPWKVPKILMSGHHEKIKEFRN
ncbi:MAG TPA: tRNA (guanosine(37)-N1)-methyltransferase TrmD [Candidatus Paceibacterota bacterium]|nr:tRNA (guanosine(37)-N1)-methyltransferase TrmD [Candidatus Paceibacterota bacterium]